MSSYCPVNPISSLNPTSSHCPVYPISSLNPTSSHCPVYPISTLNPTSSYCPVTPISNLNPMSSHCPVNPISTLHPMSSHWHAIMLFSILCLIFSSDLISSPPPLVRSQTQATEFILILGWCNLLRMYYNKNDNCYPCSQIGVSLLYI
jgi:hypothetical protein